MIARWTSLFSFCPERKEDMNVVQRSGGLAKCSVRPRRLRIVIYRRRMSLALSLLTQTRWMAVARRRLPERRWKGSVRWLRGLKE